MLSTRSSWQCGPARPGQWQAAVSAVSGWPEAPGGLPTQWWMSACQSGRAAPCTRGLRCSTASARDATRRSLSSVKGPSPPCRRTPLSTSGAISRVAVAASLRCKYKRCRLSPPPETHRPPQSLAPNPSLQTPLSRSLPDPSMRLGFSPRPPPYDSVSGSAPCPNQLHPNAPKRLYGPNLLSLRPLRISMGGTAPRLWAYHSA